MCKLKCTRHFSFGALLEVEMSKKCTPLWREAQVEVNMLKPPGVRSSDHLLTIRWQFDVDKVHALVARSTFGSQKCQNTLRWDDFWKLSCGKSARRCGAKHISKQKCTKHLSFGPLLEVEMSKKWTPVWRKAHLEVKSDKNSGVEKVHPVLARSTFGSEHVKNTPCSDTVGCPR